MPATTITCPFCNTTLKPKSPVPGGTRLKCPKCATIFVVKADDAEDVPPTEAAPPKAAGPRLGAPTPKPAAPKRPPAEEEEEDIPEVTEVIDDEDGDEEGAPAKPKKAKPKKKAIPLWVWLVGGGVGLFVLCGCCGGPIGYFAAYGIPGFGNSVTEANYKQIKKGMTEADVKKIMGGEPSLTVPVGDMKSDTWKGSGDDFITIDFAKNGKAIAGGYQFTNGALRMSGAGPLP